MRSLGHERILFLRTIGESIEVFGEQGFDCELFAQPGGPLLPSAGQYKVNDICPVGEQEPPLGNVGKGVLDADTRPVGFSLVGGLEGAAVRLPIEAEKDR